MKLIYRIYASKFVGDKWLHPCSLGESLLCLNQLVTNGLSHHYHLDESTFIIRGIRSNFSFLFHVSMKIILANRIAFCLPMSHKKDARLTWVKRMALNLSS